MFLLTVVIGQSSHTPCSVGCWSLEVSVLCCVEPVEVEAVSGEVLAVLIMYRGAVVGS